MTDVDTELDRLREFAANEVAFQNVSRRVIVHLSGEGADFVRRLTVASHILRRLRRAEATAFYRDDPAGDRAFLVSCAPWFTAEMAVPADAPALALVDWFDRGLNAPVKCPDPAWHDRVLGVPDLVLTPGLLSADPRALPDLAPPLFRPPQGEDLKARLRSMGLAEDRPFIAEGPLLDPSGDLRTLVAAVVFARQVVSNDPLVAALALAFGAPTDAPLDIDGWRQPPEPPTVPQVDRLAIPLIP